MNKKRILSGVLAVSLVLSSSSMMVLADTEKESNSNIGPAIAVDQKDTGSEKTINAGETEYTYINTNDKDSGVDVEQPTIIDYSDEEYISAQDATITDASASDALEIATVTDPLYNVGPEEPCVNGLISDSIYMENIYKSDSQNAIYFVKRVNDETYSYYYRYRVYKYDMDNNTITMMDESDRVSSSMDYYYINDKLYYTSSSE